MRTKKAFYNIVSQMSYELVAMVCGLILPRFILGAFGSAYNGTISSITQFLDYISILTLGISGSTRVALYMANASGDMRQVSAVLKATENYMRKVALAFIGYTVALALFFPLLVRSEFGWLEVSSLVVIIAIGTFAEYFFGVTYKTFLMASQSMYIYNLIHILSKIANTLVAVLLIRAGQSIHIVKLGSAFCFAATPIFLNLVVRRRFGIVSDVEPDESALKQRGKVIAHSIANLIHQYTDIFLLTLFASPSVVSVYSVYQLVLGSLSKLQHVFTSGLEGAYGDLWARGEKKRFVENFLLFEYLIYSFASVVFSCALLLILPFIRIYTRGIHDAEYILPVFAIVSVLTKTAFCIRSPYLIATQAAGKYKETKKGAFVEAGLNFGISLACVIPFGLIGVTLGTLAANIFRTIQYACFVSGHMLEEWPITAFLRRVGWLILNMGLSLCLGSLLLPTAIDTWLAWLLAGIICFTAAMLVTVLTSLCFYRKEFGNAFRLVRKMLR